MDKDRKDEPDPYAALRQTVGDTLTRLRDDVDSNLVVFRYGCMVTMLGCVYVTVRSTGALTRFSTIPTLPLGKKVVARVVGQHPKDPTVLYVYHTPFLRRVFLRETLPRGMSGHELIGDPTKCGVLAVRPFGVQFETDDVLYSHLVSKQRYVKLEMLYRTKEPDLGVCAMSTRSYIRRQDVAETAVSQGVGVCRVESFAETGVTSASCVPKMEARAQRLLHCEKHAQTMRFGRWKDWQEDELSQRIVSAGKRASNAALHKVFGVFKS
ncbi:hypothetical protein SDRG_07032 [Saprolegnia diclina VS20]|uniref:Uncharacterized protein n=1 Tax=Saprolegnia diclina (strain VS20) TaxID=1156394 RepID=T0QNB4_SAPDV|nr:hypothetical protein SDRG_07032 [Saprolegnia diclina VS20]EQC35320.1 hypothetical protein SDRG_07032 [Saprolegnia diclina VS20]|eukprot:XP_008611070.1 hypothetical protein SDRG_07032 [Saprolegnia diclina VS20]